MLGRGGEQGCGGPGLGGCVGAGFGGGDDADTIAEVNSMKRKRGAKERLLCPPIMILRDCGIGVRRRIEPKRPGNEGLNYFQRMPGRLLLWANRCPKSRARTLTQARPRQRLLMVARCGRLVWRRRRLERQTRWKELTT